MASKKYTPSPGLGKPIKRRPSAPRVTGNQNTNPPKPKNSGK
ncbi:MAG: hypothetical protein AB1861_21200 [Cyanobacteriota bacterium]